MKIAPKGSKSRIPKNLSKAFSRTPISEYELAQKIHRVKISAF
jgi:hypothetical protein